MTPLKLLYLDHEKVWRGGQEQLFTLMTGLKKRGHRIHLASPAEAPLAQRCRSEGIEHFPFSQSSEADLRAVGRLRAILSTTTFDVIHSNTPRTLISVRLAAAGSGALLAAARRVIFPLRRFSRYKYNSCVDVVTAVCRSVGDALVRDGVNSHRVQVVYEGIDLDGIDALETPPTPPETRGSVIGIVAALTEEKGHADLIRALAQTAPSPDVRCWIVGDGPLDSPLKQLVRSLNLQDVVEFLGFRSDSEALMKRMDILCLPSHSEGLSSALMAAMANRLPVVASAVGGNSELVVEGETGYLTPPGDPTALAEALKGLLASEDLRLRLGRCARRRIEENFTLQRKIETTERLYLSLLASRNKPKERDERPS